MTFPDSLDKPSRTIVTGEGGKSPSRFKHVITFEPTQAQRESLGLDGIESERVRETMNLNSNQWLRRLTPVELERLNGFPDDHTAGVPDGFYIISAVFFLLDVVRLIANQPPKGTMSETLVPSVPPSARSRPTPSSSCSHS